MAVTNTIFTWNNETPEAPVEDLHGKVDAERWAIWEDLTLTDPVKNNALITSINCHGDIDVSNGLFGMGAIQLDNTEVNELADISVFYNGVVVNNAGGSVVTIPDGVFDGQQLFIAYDRIGAHPTYHVEITAASTGYWTDAQMAPAGFMHLFWNTGGSEGTGWYVFSFNGTVVS